MTSPEFDKRFSPKITVVVLILFGLMQLPFTVNQTFKLACILTTWSDYAEFWDWDEIPIDARVHFCNGGISNFQSNNSR